VNVYVFLAVAQNRTPYTYTANAAIHSDVSRNGGEGENDTIADTPVAPATLATLEPRLVGAIFYPHGGAGTYSDPIVDTVEIKILPAAAGYEKAESPDAAGVGGFVVISDDNPGNAAATATFNPGALNGSVFRLGALRLSPAAHDFVYELQPGYDISSAQATLLAAVPANIDVFILGRQLRDPNSQWNITTNPYDGPVQDVAVQTFSLTAPHP
jgi:hypothetical protein